MDIRQIIQLSSYPNIYYIQSLSNMKDGRHKRYLYKYYDLETAIKAIIDGVIRFSEPAKWHDPFEKRFYKANYSQRFSKETHPNLQACCFTKNKNSEPSWKMYTYGKNGLAYRCVQFKINVTNLRKELLKDKDVKYYEGDVAYLSEWSIKNIHNPRKDSYRVFFEPNLTLEKYINLLLLKREAFSYEGERRFFRIPNDKCITNTDVKIDWNTILEEIKLSADITELEKYLFEEVCKSRGIDLKVVKNNLNNHGKNIKIK